MGQKVRCTQQILCYMLHACAQLMDQCEVMVRTILG